MNKRSCLPAAFGRLCVETDAVIEATKLANQPPSGGCVLKHGWQYQYRRYPHPAAFGRLCVETSWLVYATDDNKRPAAFGRLCVETSFVISRLNPPVHQPPSGGCVLKPPLPLVSLQFLYQPPSGGCVLKHATR